MWPINLKLNFMNMKYFLYKLDESIKFVKVRAT